MANVTEVCEVKPVQAFLSTNLNNKNKTFKDLADKIMYQLGYPSVSIELQINQVYSAIQNAIEFFTKYAGYKEEFLLFDSRLYEKDKGIRLDKLCTIASSAACQESPGTNPALYKKHYDVTHDIPKRNYVAIKNVPQEELPDTYSAPIHMMTVITADEYDKITTYNPILADFFKIDRGPDWTIEGERVEEQPKHYENAFDYDLMDYRRVCQVIGFNKSSNRSLTSLFSFESAIASQAYNMYQFSLRGFDLLSFHTLHEFMKTRERTLALDTTFNFNPRTQYLTLYPQPKDYASYYAVIQCRVEAPLRDVIDRIWVYKYALAQCKMMLGMIRGRFGQVQLAGGAVLADNNNLRDMGQREMEALESELISGSAFSEKKFPVFFIG